MATHISARLGRIAILCLLAAFMAGGLVAAYAREPVRLTAIEHRDAPSARRVMADPGPDPAVRGAAVIITRQPMDLSRLDAQAFGDWDQAAPVSLASASDQRHP